MYIGKFSNDAERTAVSLRQLSILFNWSGMGVVEVDYLSEYRQISSVI